MKLNKAILNFGAYLLALFILIFIFVSIMDPKQFSVLLDFSPFQIAVTLFLSLGAYIGNGAEYYIMCRKMNIKMEKKDILLLPLAMNLAGTILPFQGAVTYQIFLMKQKYSAEFSKGCSIAALLYLITVAVSGITGMVIFCAGKTDSILFLLISLLFSCTPAIVIIMFKMMKNISLPGKLDKIWQFICKTLAGIVSICTDIKTTVILITIYLLRMFSMVLMFYWIAMCLNINVFFTAIVLMNLWNMLSLLLKFTPNNLGISQLISGVMFSMINLPESDGILLSFASTIAFLIMAFSAGTASMAYHFWQISLTPVMPNSKKSE